MWQFVRPLSNKRALVFTADVVNVETLVCWYFTIFHDVLNAQPLQPKQSWGTYV